MRVYRLGENLNYSTFHNVVVGNRVETTTRSYAGIGLAYSTDNLFYHNYVSGFSFGLRLWFSPNNTIVGNTVADSFEIMSFGASANNIIYHNNFVENLFKTCYVIDQYFDGNVREAFPNMFASTSVWGNGTQGNYWGDYNGTDGDGIGDLPYIVYERTDTSSGYGIDHFPFMNRIDTSNVPIELPDWASALFATLPKVSHPSISIPTQMPSPTLTLNPTLTPSSLTPTFLISPSSSSPSTPNASSTENTSPYLSPSIPEFPVCIVVSLLFGAAALLVIAYRKK
jgi:parallel beta-helix repeat protein